jgi:hypothetical protein
MKFLQPLILSGFAFLALGAPAAQAALSCEMAGFEDYAVEINFQSKLAAFFDNNEWAIVPEIEKKNEFASTISFVGEDNFGSYLEIVFDGAEMGAESYIKFKQDGRLKKAALDCSYRDEAELNSGI